jgi:hypothetical protein
MVAVVVAIPRLGSGTTVAVVSVGVHVGRIGLHRWKLLRMWLLGAKVLLANGVDVRVLLKMIDIFS